MQFTRRDILNAGASLAALAAASAPGRLLAQGAEEIRFGSLTPNTRAGSLFGPGMQRAIEHAVADVNALGGLLGGRKIRLFSEDSQSDPDAGVRAAKKLIEVNRVKTLLGTWSSGVTMAVAPIVMQSQVLNMNCSGTTDLRDMKKDDWIWPVAGSNISYGRMMGEYAVQAGYKKASFLAFNNPSGITLGAEFKKLFEGAGGTCEVIVYNPNQPSYKAELSRALAGKPQVIALGSYLPDTTIILKEWYVMDVPVAWVGPIWAVSAGLVSAVGPKASDGIVSIGALPNDQSTAYASFRDRYEKEMKQEVLTNPFAAMAYDMVAVSALAIESAKSDNPAEFRKHIRKVSSAPGEKVFGLKEALAMVRAGKDIDYEGVGGNMDFDEVGEARPYFGSWKVEGGKLVLKGRIKA